jgi:hypothetical protein
VQVAHDPLGVEKVRVRSQVQLARRVQRGQPGVPARDGRRLDEPEMPSETSSTRASAMLTPGGGAALLI